MKVIERPEQLEAGYFGVLKIFEELDKARKTIEAAQRCNDPSDAIYYRDALDALVRLEAQADALTYVFHRSREELKQWLADMKVYYKTLEEQS